MNRRSFLRGALAVSVVAALPAVMLETLPVVYGDGLHDDWAGLQAMFDGKPFVVENEAITVAGGRINGGEFLISRTLRLCNRFSILNSTIVASDDWDGEENTMFYVGEDVVNGGMIQNCILDGRSILRNLMNSPKGQLI